MCSFLPVYKLSKILHSFPSNVRFFFPNVENVKCFIIFWWRYTSYINYTKQWYKNLYSQVFLLNKLLYIIAIFDGIMKHMSHFHKIKIVLALLVYTSFLAAGWCVLRRLCLMLFIIDVHVLCIYNILQNSRWYVRLQNLIIWMIRRYLHNAFLSKKWHEILSKNWILYIIIWEFSINSSIVILNFK